jgi:hypothetical protein
MPLVGILFIILFSSEAFSESGFTRGIKHSIEKDRIARDGQIHIQYRELDHDFIELKLDYRFRYRVLLVGGSYNGTRLQQIPASFASLEGYLELEQVGSYEDERVRLDHRGRRRWQSYYDCHQIQLTPKGRRATWNGLLTYCPELPELGFAEIELQVREIPVLGTHTLKSRFSGM